MNRCCCAHLHVEDSASVSLDVGGDFYAIGPPHYRGPYEFTPSQQAQTIQIDGKVAEHDITVNPIPSNYGLITWDGSVLTVS